MKTTKNDAFWEDMMSQIDDREYKRVSRKMEVAAFLYDTLKAKGISQKQFAKMMGKNASEVSKWLSGTHNFTIDTLTDIEGVLGVKLFHTDQPVLIEKPYTAMSAQLIIIENEISLEPTLNYNLDYTTPFSLKLNGKGKSQTFLN